MNTTDRIDRTDPGPGNAGAPGPSPSGGVSPAEPRPRRDARARRGPRLAAGLLWPALVGLAVLVLPLAMAVGITATASAEPAAERAAQARLVTAADLERDYGISVKLIALSADGGLVDFRFIVTDSEKAQHVLHDAASMPGLYVETAGAVLRAPRPLAHKMTLLDGSAYFLLYPNSGGVVQAGTSVSVVIDDVRLEAIGARS